MVQRFFVGFGKIFYKNILPDEPVVAGFFVAAHKRKFSGKCIQVIESFKVFAAVVWANVNSFVRSPNQRPFIIFAF
jgi:hypothetical protein